MKPHLWFITLIGVIVPRRLRFDWKQEWEAELRYRELLLADWDKLNWRTKLDLLWRSLGAFWDALVLQPRRLEDDMFQDLNFGLRLMLKHKALTFVAILSLALGIGANSAIFSVVNAVMLRPLPYASSAELVKVMQAPPDPARGAMPAIWSYPRFEVLRDQSSSFVDVAAHTEGNYNLTGTNEPERLRVEMVSASYFPLLGLEAVAGRTFVEEEDRTPGSNLSALLSYGLWQRRFGGDPQAIGKTLELDKHSFTIVGVLPPWFKGQDGTADAWVTMMAAPVLRFKGTLINAKNYWFQVIGRLKPGVTIEQAQHEMQAVSQAIEQLHPGPSQTRASGTNRDLVTLVPLLSSKVDPAIKRSFLLLLAAVGLVLLIACANVANLLLARGVARRKEFALRAALGAGRLRLARQLLTEALLLSFAGGLLGVLFGRWGVYLLMKFRPSDNARFWSSYTRTFDYFTVDLDWRVLAFSFSLACLTGVLFGLLPALQSSRTDVNEALKEGTGASVAGFHRFHRVGARSLLVIGEIALSLVLMVGAGLMLRSLARLQKVDLGFSPDGVLTMEAPSRDAKSEFYEQVLGRVQALPGIEAASLGSTAPLLGYASKTVMDIQGRPTGGLFVGLHSVTPSYFQTLGIPLLRGRAFTEQDRAGSPRVAVINQSAAEKYFAGEEPLGQRIKPYIGASYETSEEFIEIVGIFGNAKYTRLEEEVEPDIYLSALQPTDAAQVLIVRSRLDLAAVTAAVRSEVMALDNNVPLTWIRTLTERVAEVTSPTRFIAQVLGVFAGMALLVSAIGIYGVMAYNVSSRRREIGIRIALGAQARDVRRLVLRDGLTLTGAGLVLGGLAAWAAVRLLKSQLYEVSANDPLTFCVVGLLLAVVALWASYLPARKAVKTDPLAALRCE